MAPAVARSIDLFGACERRIHVSLQAEEDGLTAAGLAEEAF